MSQPAGPDAAPTAAPHPDLDRLRRWEENGGTWKVAGRRRAPVGGGRGEEAAEEVTVSLQTCTGGEEMEVMTSAEPALLAYVRSGESGEPAAL